MPRRKSPPKRQIPPDNKYNSVHVAMFINRMMYGGKKSTAQRIMYQAFDIIEERTKKNPLEVFEQALRNVTPSVEVKPRRVGGSTYQVPIEVDRDRRGIPLAMRWILQNARTRGGRGMSNKLAAELMDAAEGQGASVKKKDDTHRMAEANRAFAHFR
ncbi:MAG: 30S ribosomal protein S7 [Phototrophicales bacterium]|nr:MAG: 30S ribosomal protein S7 [Phototrophicales bacterium]RMG75848.1 MAG: 30S ribosomal protein S7 [Chloroflexota bacterium]